MLAFRYGKLILVVLVLVGCNRAGQAVKPTTPTVADTDTKLTSVAKDEAKRAEFSDLAAAVRQAHDSRDVKAFTQLIIGAPGRPADVENHIALFKADLARPLESIDFVPVDERDQLEYELGGVIYRPAAKPAGWIRMDLRTADKKHSESNDVEVTRMLVGRVDGQWWIIAAAPVSSTRAASPTP